MERGAEIDPGAVEERDAAPYGDGSTPKRPSAAPAGPIRAVFRRPPQRLFHLLLLAPAAALLYSASVPGSVFSAVVVGYLTTVAFMAIWLLRTLTYRLARHRDREHGRARWFLVAPVIGIVVVVLLAGAVPLHARWALSRGAFDDALAAAPSATARDQSVDFDAPTRIGSYRITGARRAGDAVVFYEAHGNFLGTAGFVYLPDGPRPDLRLGMLGGAHFRSLGGSWYAWTASW